MRIWRTPVLAVGLASLVLTALSCSGSGPRRTAAPAPATEQSPAAENPDPEKPVARGSTNPWEGAQPGCAGLTSSPIAFVLGINGTQLRKSFLWVTAVGSAAVKRYSKDPFNLLLHSRCRVDLLTQTTRLLVGSPSWSIPAASPSAAAALVEGNFNARELLACLKKLVPPGKGRLVPVLVSGKRALEIKIKGHSKFCLIAAGPHTVAIARPGFARSAALGEAHFGNADLSRVLKKANRTALAWGAFFIPTSSGKKGARFSPIPPLGNIRSGLFETDPRPGKRWVAKLAVTTRSAADAKSLVKMVQLMKRSSAPGSLASPGTKKAPTAPRSANLFSSLTAKAHGAQVVAELRFTEQQMKTLFALTGGAGTTKP